MKKYVILFMLLFMGYHVASFAQAVDDRAVVPVSVTLNSILRLNIESGGNVEFNFNTLNQYNTGITGLNQDDEYSTKITIASSVNWNLEMGAEDPYLVTTDYNDTTTASAQMPLNYIVYQTTITGTLPPANVTINSLSTPQALEQIGNTTNPLIASAGTNAGDVAQNAFRIDWGCGLPGPTASAGTLLGSNLTGGRYSTNVFFILQPAP